MISPNNVHSTLARHQLADGFDFVLDLARSHGSWLVDARDGREYLDFFTCFASWPIGYDHPGLRDAAFRERLLQAALNNPSNSDLYTSLMADFVQCFATHATPPGYPHHFWISGGALAVENAIKVAFDWKARKLGLDSIKDDGASLVALHFRQAFHGRSGYTMSMTNTDPKKVALFPKFCWPRVHNPAIVFDLEGRIANDIEAEERKSCADIEEGFRQFKGRVACIVVEPMQGEGGDNHFRPEFLAKLRRYADENEALLVFDEVQTGFFGSGKPWLWQHHGVAPDVVAFGKKTQICGLYANTRVDEVADNVFALPSRINSTWGGSLTDMVRSQRILEVIVADKLGDNVAAQGARFVAGLRSIARGASAVSNVRGVGSLAAFTLPDTATRGAWLDRMQERGFLALPSGPQSIRFRMPLSVSAGEVDRALEILSDCAKVG